MWGVIALGWGGVGPGVGMGVSSGAFDAGVAAARQQSASMGKRIRAAGAGRTALHLTKVSVRFIDMVPKDT